MHSAYLLIRQLVIQNKISREKTEQGPAFPHSRHERSCAGHSLLSVNVAFGTHLGDLRAEPLRDSFLDFCVGVESVNHRWPTRWLSLWAKSGPFGGRPNGCNCWAVRWLRVVRPLKLHPGGHRRPTDAEVQEAVSESNEFLYWRQHSLITRCDKCTDLQGDYEEIRSLFSRIEKNAVLDKTRPKKQTFSLPFRPSYVTILSRFGAKKKKASVVCTYKRSNASRSRNHCCSGKATRIT